MDDAANRKSPYFWWYEYLKRHEGYRACCTRGGTGPYSKLYEDFGNVHQQAFREWWKEHKGLFYSPDPFTLETITTPEDFEWYKGDDSLIVVVNLLSPKRMLQRAFRKLLQERRPGKRGRPQWDDWADYYPLATRPDIQGLEKTLKVFDLRNDKSKNLTLWQIGEELKLNLNQMTKRGDSRADMLDKHSVMTATVSRYLRHANAYIENVGRGLFPKR